MRIKAEKRPVNVYRVIYTLEDGTKITQMMKDTYVDATLYKRIKGEQFFSANIMAWQLANTASAIKDTATDCFVIIRGNPVQDVKLILIETIEQNVLILDTSNNFSLKGYLLSLFSRVFNNGGL